MASLTRCRTPSNGRAVMRASPILLTIAGIALLCAMDAAVKVVSLQESVLMGAWLRYAFGSALMIPVIWLLRRRLPPRGRWHLHVLRGALMGLMGYLFFLSISILPMAETLTIAFVAPLLVPPMAAMFIGERMRLKTVVAGIVGFGGVIVTLQGAESGVDPAAADLRMIGVGAALLSALLYAVQSVILRSMAQKDDAFAITMLSALVPCVLMSPFLVFFAAPPTPSILPTGALAGLLGSAGALMLAQAYARAEAQILILFEYTGLLWAALLGWFLFDEVPRLEIFLGAAIIAGACLTVTWSDRAPRVPQKKSAF